MPIWGRWEGEISEQVKEEAVERVERPVRCSVVNGRTGRKVQAGNCQITGRALDCGLGFLLSPLELLLLGL